MIICIIIKYQGKQFPPQSLTRDTVHCKALLQICHVFHTEIPYTNVRYIDETINHWLTIIGLSMADANTVN